MRNDYVCQSVAAHRFSMDRLPAICHCGAPARVRPCTAICAMGARLRYEHMHRQRRAAAMTETEGLRAELLIAEALVASIERRIGIAYDREYRRKHRVRINARRRERRAARKASS